MAELMQTSQAQLDRLLDPDNSGTSLETLMRAAEKALDASSPRADVRLIAPPRSGKPEAYAAASARLSPSGSALIARSSVRAGPLGRLAPRSHSCTVLMLK